jgi:hypothetical protein
MSYQAVTLVDGSGSEILATRLGGIAHSTPARIQVDATRAKGIAALANFVNLASLAWRVSREIDALKVDAGIAWWANNGSDYCYPTSRVGALVVVLLWAPRNGLPVAFGDAYIGSYGLDAGMTLGKYLREGAKNGTIVPSPPAGCDSNSKYIWRTLD